MAFHGGYESAARFYDLFDNKDNIEFFYHYAEGKEKILDIGAGTGRIAIHIATRGIDVYCIEPSEQMIKIFMKKLDESQKLKSHIRIIRDEAETFRLPTKFPLAILSGTFDHFIDESEKIEALKNISRHLEKNGKLVFDVYIGHMKASNLHPAGKVTRDGKEFRRFISSEITEDKRMKVNLVYEVYENNELIERVVQESIAGTINIPGIRNLMNETGFKIINEFGNFYFSDYQEGDEMFIVEAIKAVET